MSWLQSATALSTIWCGPSSPCRRRTTSTRPATCLPPAWFQGLRRTRPCHQTALSTPWSIPSCTSCWSLRPILTLFPCPPTGTILAKTARPQTSANTTLWPGNGFTADSTVCTLTSTHLTPTLVKLWGGAKSFQPEASGARSQILLQTCLSISSGWADLSSWFRSCGAWTTKVAFWHRKVHTQNWAPMSLGHSQSLDPTLILKLMPERVAC